MANALDITLHATAPEEGSSAGTAIDIGSDRTVADIVLDVLALSGTIDVSIETAITGADWEVVVALPQQTEPNTISRFVSGLKRYVRARWVLSAGGTATFLVNGQAHQTYANADDIAQALPAPVFTGIEPEVLARATLNATDEAAGYLRAHKTLPLIKWDTDLRLHVAKMAFYHAMLRRGFNPDNDPTIRMGYTDAIAWLKGASKYADMTDSRPTTDVETEAIIVTGPERGWGPM